MQPGPHTKDFRNRDKNQGFSLIEALIAVAIISVVAIGLASVLTNMNREQRALLEKFALVEVNNTLLTTFLDTNTCASQINQLAPILDLTSVTTTPPVYPAVGPVIPLNQLQMSSAPTAPLVAKVTEPLPGFPPNQMVVEKIEVTNLVTTGDPNVYKGDLQVSIKPKTMVRALKPAGIKVIFTVLPSPTLASAKIQGCGIIGAGMGPWTPVLSNLTQLAPDNGLVVVTSCNNCGIKVSTEMSNAGSCAGVTLTGRVEVAARDKYGQGVENTTLPVKKDECWKVEMTDKSQSVIATPANNILFRAL